MSDRPSLELPTGHSESTFARGGRGTPPVDTLGRHKSQGDDGEQYIAEIVRGAHLGQGLTLTISDTGIGLG
jgi:hypothetical protein